MAKKRWHLIEVQILLIIILVVTALSIISSFIALNLEKKEIEKDLLQNASLISSMVYRSLEVAMIDNDKTHVQQMVKNLSTAKNIEHIRIYDLEGRIWSGEGQERLSRKKIEQVLGGGSYTALFGQEGGKETLDILTPVHSDQSCYPCHDPKKKQLGIIEVAITTEEVERRAAAYRFRVSLTTLVTIIAIILALVMALNRLLVQPVEKLTAMAERILKGDLSSRVDLKDRNEIGELGGVLNLMADSLEKNIDEIKQTKLKLETAVKNIGEAMSAALDLTSLSKVIVEQAMFLSDCDTCSMMLVDEEGRLAVSASSGLAQREIERYVQAPLRTDDDVLFPAVVSKTIIEAADLSNKTDLKRLAIKKGARSIYSFPLVIEGRTIGLINIVFLREKVINPSETRVLYTLSSQAAVAIGHVHLHEKVKKLAVTDDLTGLPNVRAFYERIEMEVERSRRFKHEFTLAMIDIDDFKVYNDTYGHLVGDEVLHQLAGVLDRGVRSLDLIARYGGEEFVVMMVETPLKEAKKLAERLRVELAEHAFTVSNGKRIKDLTVSIGLAGYPKHANTVRGLVDQADQALLKAKRAGKNRVETARSKG